MNKQDQYSFIKDIVNLCKIRAIKAIDRMTDLIKVIGNKRDISIQNVQDVLLFGEHNHHKPFFVNELVKVLPNIQVGIPDELLSLYTKYCEK